MTEEMICTVNYKFTVDFTCRGYRLFDDSPSLSSGGFEYIPSQNFNPSMSLLFYEIEEASQLVRVYKLLVTSIDDDRINFQTHQFFLNNEIKFTEFPSIQSFGFPLAGTNETMTILMAYDSSQIIFIRLSNFSVYEPMFRELDGENVFVNEEYVMIVNFESSTIEYIHLQFGYSLQRTIWPSFKLAPLLSGQRVFVIHDFFLAKLAGNPRQIVTVKVPNANPYISKQNLLDISASSIKFLRTDYFSLVVFALDSGGFWVLLSSNVLKYQLSSSRSSSISEDQQKSTTLFSFFTIFSTFNQHIYLNRININIPREYFIDSPGNTSQIRLDSRELFVDLTTLFSGNIYTIDFKSEGGAGRPVWIIENSPDHKFEMTVPEKPVQIEYTPALYIIPMRVVNAEELPADFEWGLETHTRDHLFVDDHAGKQLAFFRQVSDKEIILLALIDYSHFFEDFLESISMKDSLLFIVSHKRFRIFDVSCVFELISFERKSLGNPVYQMDFLNQPNYLKKNYLLAGET